MNKDTFWEIIDRVNEAVDRNDQRAVLIETENQLMKYPASDIATWHQIRQTYTDIANRNDLWVACAATESHCTDDGFIDFRSWLISQGKETYMATLHNPDSLAERDIPAGSADFELYGYVAYDAYTQRKALESENLKSILHKCCTFAAENSTRIFDMCRQHPINDSDKYQRLTNACVRALGKEYDIYDAIERHPIAQEIINDIQSEINLRPDISSGWSYPDLPQLVPQLYQKYSAAQESPQMC